MAGQDIMLGFENKNQICPDLIIEDGDLKADNGLETATLISLWSDRRVEDEDNLPEGETDQRGWWGDEVSSFTDDKIGSILWTSERGKTDIETQNRIKEGADDALKWMIDDGVAASVENETELAEQGRIELRTKIFKPLGDDIPFQAIWDAQDLRRGA